MSDKKPDTSERVFADGVYEGAMSFALDRVDDIAEEMDGAFPSHGDEPLHYEQSGAEGWTPSFWTGICWLAHEYTGSDRYRDIAMNHIDAFRTRLASGEVDTHDLGFLYTLSSVTGWQLTGDEAARQDGLEAADYLADRYRPEAEILQAWESYHHRDWSEEWVSGRFIVDCMMNLPLLYWAAEQTGYDRYRDIAATHADQTSEYLVRNDGSTAHTFQMDVETGETLGPETHQGYADDSAWARGQGWAIYGFALSYRYTGDETHRDTARTVADWYVDHLPDDGIPRWDFDAPETDDHRDTSAAAIATCGLFELSSALPRGDPDRRRYEDIALDTLSTLAEAYTTEGEDATGILGHGVDNKPDDKGVDRSLIYGDYFYLEGLVRALTDWQPYW
jgi:unsaturated chondroitin disaccharide hydrolase